MRLIKIQILWKGLAFIRFLIAKFYYYQIFSGSKIGLIGPKCSLLFGFQNMPINIGNKLIMLGNVELISKGELKIGNNFCINRFSRVVCLNKIKIGNNVTVAQFVSILDHNHKGKIIDGSLKFKEYDVGCIEIGNNVWIGDKVTILKDVTIGSNVIIAANAVVVSDVPSNSIVGGVPARILKSLIGKINEV